MHIMPYPSGSASLIDPSDLFKIPVCSHRFYFKLQWFLPTALGTKAPIRPLP